MFDKDITWFDAREAEITEAMKTCAEALSGLDITVVIGVFPNDNNDAVPVTVSNVADTELMPTLFAACSLAAHASVSQGKFDTLTTIATQKES